MLSMVPIKSAKDARDYFENDNYYLKDTPDEKAARQWWGRGAELLGIKGEVKFEQLESLLKGKLPNGALLKSTNGFEHRPGYDLTFSAPKSVSMLAEIAGDKRVIRAHDSAVKEALEYLQNNAVETRVFSDGLIKFQKVDNLIVARFRHGTARAVDGQMPDPDTHTHCVVINAVCRADGKWRAISSENMFEHKMCAGAIYRNALARKLLRMGYEIVKTHDDGRFEVKALNRDEIEHFSKRRMQIEKVMDESGVSGSIAANLVAKSSRAGKEDVATELLKSDWERQAKELGIHLSEIAKNANKRLYSDIKVTAQAAVLDSISSLSQKDAAFTTATLMKETLALSIGKFTISDIETEVKLLTEQGILIKAGANHLTTQKAIDLEKDNIELMRSLKNTLKPIAPEKNIVSAQNLISMRPGREDATLSQKEAVGKILASKDGVIAVNGIAGSGKTTMIKSVVNAAQKSGYEIIGLAPQSSQAETLGVEAKINTENLSLFLAKNTENNYTNKRLILLDEAGMTSSVDMNKILRHVSKNVNTRIVMLGDVKQLPSIDAGAAFGQLIKNGVETVKMLITQRQENRALESAVYSTLAGNIERAFEKIGSSVRQIKSPEERLEAIAKNFLKRSESVRKRTVVLAATNQDRKYLNKLIRDGLKKSGVLTGVETQTNILITKPLTKAQRCDSYRYETGNLIRFNANHKGFGVKRGEYFNIKSVCHDTKKLTISQGKKELSFSLIDIAKMQDGGIELYKEEPRKLQAGDFIKFSRIIDRKEKITTSKTAEVLSVSDNKIKLKMGKKIIKFDTNNPMHKHWDYAFSSTVHSAQGKTADYVIANLDSNQGKLTNQSSFYVTISRARYEAELYTDSLKKTKGSLERNTGANLSAIDAVKKLPKTHVNAPKKSIENNKTAKEIDLAI